MSGRKTIILAGVLLDGSGAPARRGIAITMVGDRISAVEPSASVDVGAKSDTSIIDARDCTATPGLIDAHVHLAWGQDHQPGWIGTAGNVDAIHRWSVDAAGRALAAGITAVRDCGAPGLVTLELRDAISSGKTVGPRIVAAGPAITTTGGHGEFIGVHADDENALRLRVQELGRAGVDFIKVMASGGSMDPHTNRRRAQYTTAALTALVDEAHRHALPVVAHCNATESIRRAVAARVDTIAHASWLGDAEGTIEYDPAVAMEIVARDIVIDLNLAATMRPLSEYDGQARSWSAAAHRPANRWALHTTMRERGARLLLSSDEFGPGVATFPRLLAKAIAVLQLDPAEAIHRATMVPAGALMLADQMGIARPGFVADLAIFDGDVTADPSSLERCRAVWRGGQLVAENGRLARPSTVSSTGAGVGMSERRSG